MNIYMQLRRRSRGGNHCSTSMDYWLYFAYIVVWKVIETFGAAIFASYVTIRRPFCSRIFSVLFYTAIETSLSPIKPNSIWYSANTYLVHDSEIKKNAQQLLCNMTLTMHSYWHLCLMQMKKNGKKRSNAVMKTVCIHILYICVQEKSLR